MKSTSSTNIPLKHFHPHQTPDWDDELKLAQRTANKAYKAWCSGGKLRNPDHPFRVAYKTPSEFSEPDSERTRKMYRRPFSPSYNSSTQTPGNLFEKSGTLMATPQNEIEEAIRIPEC